MLENFPYIGGDNVSGTGNLTGAYCFVSMGEVLKGYGVQMEEIGHLMVLAYERRFNSMPGIVKTIARKSFTNVKSLNKKYLKKDAQNAANAAENPGSFETKTMIPPEKGYDFSYHNLVCPLSDFAKTYGYEEYMPYLCNLDYVMFGVFGSCSVCSAFLCIGNTPALRTATTATLSSKWTQSLWNTGRRSLHRARDINKIAGNDLNRYPRIICILRRMSKRSTPKGYSAA